MRRITVWLFALILSGCIADPRLSSDPETRIELLQTSRGHAQRWAPEDFPIDVVVDLTMNQEYQRATEAAVEGWNRILGFRALTIRKYTPLRLPIDSPERGQISVAERELGENEYQVRLYGSARNRFSSVGLMRYVRISLDPGIPTEAQLPVLIHEFGHALGLRHDEESPYSIMFPSIDDTICQAIQAEDVEAVRQQNLF